MKKINQGRYEILTTKSDAINKFMQMQGMCREKVSDENRIEFYCSKKGKITITNPPTRSVRGHISTELFADIVEQNGKTYVSYYTSFSKVNNALKSIFFILDMVINIILLIFAFLSDDKIWFLLVLALSLGGFIFYLFNNLKEEKNSPEDSKILINELKKRVEAVNLWDK